MTRTLELATEIVRTLQQSGYIAYFAGGWVRDFVMGHPSDDIDIATSASPEEILQLFPKASHVGIAFGVVIVILENIPFEVATFRKDDEYQDGRRPVGFSLATPEEDAARRDFTINGMFFDPIKEEVYDFVGGREDIKKRVIHTIGSARARFAEDRLRMIRAIRFSSRFNFRIVEETWEAIVEHADTLFPAVAPERIWQEWQKMAKAPRIEQAVCDLQKTGLLQEIFPELKGSAIEPLKILPTFPSIFSVMQLFPRATHSTVEKVCTRLRTSVKQMKQAELLVLGRRLFTQDTPDLVELTHFFADPLSDAVLQMVELEQKKSLDHFRQKRDALKKHIERIQKRAPLITSSHLKKAGISPGPKMGELLRLAERLAITEDLHDPAPILQRIL